MEFNDRLAIRTGKKPETVNDIKWRWSYHSWYQTWSAVGRQLSRTPQNIPALPCSRRDTAAGISRFRSGQFCFQHVRQDRDFANAPCLFFFQKNCDTGQISKTESSAQKLLQEIHSFSSTKAPCFALLSRAEGIGVYKSQQILDSGCITHGETSGIIFFLISNMLTLQDLERMAAHHTWQDSSEDYRTRRSLRHLS